MDKRERTSLIWSLATIFSVVVWFLILSASPVAALIIAGLVIAAPVLFGWLLLIAGKGP